MSPPRASNLEKMHINGLKSLLLPTWLGLLAFVPVACVETEAPNPINDQVAGEAAPESQWYVLEDSTVISLTEAQTDDELQAAINVALASAAQERENWQYSNPQQKQRWAIKWAASTADDRIEYVWVRPVQWSAYRVEGVLANTPQNELTCNKTLGEYVSFPVEEMADWIRFLSDDFSGPYEGGYTLEVLTNRYGTPQP